MTLYFKSLRGPFVPLFGPRCCRPLLQAASALF